MYLGGDNSKDTAEPLIKPVKNETEEKEEKAEDDSTLYNKIVIILRLAMPAIITSCVTRGQDIVNLIFLGHYKGRREELQQGHNDGSAFLAGIGLGNLCEAFLGLTLIVGMNGALDTLVSQAAGAGNLELCGVYLNRGRFIMTLMFIPLSVLTFNVESILLYFDQNALAAKYAQQYVIAYLPGLYFQCL